MSPSEQRTFFKDLLRNALSDLHQTFSVRSRLPEAILLQRGQSMMGKKKTPCD